MKNNNNEEYNDKAYNIFNLLNQFRANPRQLAHHLEKLKKYLDKSTNVLSEPDKIQFQMIEGEKVIDEAVKYLKNLPPIPPLEWEDALAQSAQQHVNDIGPKGILSYQSSDGTEPEDRITKYGNYMDALGENIDFGPNDEIGVIVSMTLDDGEIERPHRENLFNNDYKKIGIACGPHKTEFQMCVMDFAGEFFPNKNAINNKNLTVNNDYLDNIQNNNNDDTENAYNLLKNSVISSKNIKNNSSNNINNSEENLKKDINGNENNNANILDSKMINTISSKNNINNNNSNNNNSNNNNAINKNNLKNNSPNYNSVNNNAIYNNSLNNSILINNILKNNKIEDIEKMKKEVKEINSHKKIVQKKNRNFYYSYL